MINSCSSKLQKSNDAPGPPFVKPEPICTNSAVPMVPIPSKTVRRSSFLPHEKRYLTSDANQLDMPVLNTHEVVRFVTMVKKSTQRTFSVLVVLPNDVADITSTSTPDFSFLKSLSSEECLSFDIRELSFRTLGFCSDEMKFLSHKEELKGCRISGEGSFVK